MVASRCSAAPSNTLLSSSGVATTPSPKVEDSLLDGLAVEPVHRKVDAEALLGAIDEFLAEGGADVDIRDALAVAHDRRHAENAQRFAPGFDADDLLAGP